MQVNEDLYGLACMTSYPSDPWLGRVGRGRQPYMGTSRLLTPPKPARKRDPVQSCLPEVLFCLFIVFSVYFRVDFPCFKNVLEEAIHSVQEKAVLLYLASLCLQGNFLQGLFYSTRLVFLF